ncbi:ATP-binding protein [Aeromicrobium alkaliterrae]|uniref:ATP-binding protein n=1 Tax=Aeromicrobium alkaliterrae TaxID=302168 RepID=A0ABN2JGE2_9ACTN
MARLVLMCGLAGAGKSTYARALESRGWRRFSIDVEMWRLGHDESTTDLDELAAGIRAAHRQEIAQALDAGQDVVVDYSFSSRSQRDDYRALGRAHGAVVEVVYLETAEHVLRRRLAHRRGGHADDVIVEPELFERHRAGFEPPDDDEPDVTVISTLD